MVSDDPATDPTVDPTPVPSPGPTPEQQGYYFKSKRILKVSGDCDEDDDGDNDITLVTR